MRRRLAAAAAMVVGVASCLRVCLGLGQRGELQPINQINMRKCGFDPSKWNNSANASYVAVARLRGINPVMEKFTSGYVLFEQQRYRGPVRITVNITGMIAGLTMAMFITEFGRYPCSASGDHYNPWDVEHGDAASCRNRHAGDIESVQTDVDGNVYKQQWDPIINIPGNQSIIGRSVVLMFNDQYDESDTNFNMSCGVIGWAANTSISAVDVYSVLHPNDVPLPAGRLWAGLALLALWYVMQISARKSLSFYCKRRLSHTWYDYTTNDAQQRRANMARLLRTRDARVILPSEQKAAAEEAWLPADANTAMLQLLLNAKR